MKKMIYLQQIGNIDQLILLDLKKGLNKFFKDYLISVECSDKLIPLDEFSYNPIEMKYNGSEILKRLLECHQKSEFSSVLGVINEDIKSLKRKYIFGIARTKSQSSLKKNGFFTKPGVALISIYRLREKFYSRPENNSLFKNRILKISIHELGHSLGLKKCRNECIMKCKRTITEVDKKTINLCEKCQKYLKTLFLDL